VSAIDQSGNTTVHIAVYLQVTGNSPNV
jgi:hypothetical protein